MPVTYTNVGGEESSTITFRVGTVQIARGTTNEQQEVLIVGDPQTSNALARVVAAAPVSTEFGLIVRVAGGPSSVADLAVRAVLPSTAADNLVTNTIGLNLQSTSLPASNSSGLNVWIVGGLVTAISSLSTGHVTVDTGSVRVIQSSANELLVTNTIGTNLQSTSAPSSGSSGLVVRQVVDGITTVNSTTALGTTSFTVQTSAAGIRTYVTAYSLLSTAGGPLRVYFYDGVTILWPMIFAALTSAISGANLAVPAPAYLFRGSVAAGMTIQSDSTQSSFHAAVSYYRAP